MDKVKNQIANYVRVNSQKNNDFLKEELSKLIS
jgi:hypothetical protein